MRPLVVLLAAGVALPAAAQRPDAPPVRPDSVLSAGPTGTGFREWREMIAARGRTGASYLVDGDRYSVLLMTPMAVDALAQDSLIVQATKGCQRALSLGDEQVEWTRSVDPWTAFDSAAYARPLVAIAIYPREQRRYDCHAGNLPRFAALSRGALYGSFGLPKAVEQVAAVEVRRDGLIEFAALSGRAPVTKVTHTRIVNDDGSEHVRVWLDPQAFAPDAEGRVPRLEVHVFNPVDPEPDVLPIPDVLIRAVWQQMLPWQARSLDSTDAQLTPVAVDFEVPQDSALRAAYEQFRRGAMGAAASGALTRLMFRPRPAQREIRDAMVEAAVAFSMRDRDAEALFLITDVMEVYPCLTLAPEVPQALREMADAVRKPARCTSIPLPMVALRSFVPGLGQATGPLRRRLALTSFVATAATYAAAEAARSYARDSYRSYVEYQGGESPRAPARYRRAQNARVIGNALTIGAVGLWVGSGVEAVWNEYQHKRRIDEVQNVGAPRRRAGGVSVAPAIAADRVGLSVSFR